jgi:hypothetical protein
MRFSKVVLPEPKKPVKMVTGMRLMGNYLKIRMFELGVEMGLKR